MNTKIEAHVKFASADWPLGIYVEGERNIDQEPVARFAVPGTDVVLVVTEDAATQLALVMAGIVSELKHGDAVG